ncbi:LacI family DNA-binding transcriptional regulator [Burkholderia sp. BCC0044]|uniref:LacI family DNA-binding transcriptional regulator n=1 Tax=Burkholderia sp. BCC0044 TaxID=2676295 RepID=UPI00158BE650|nr:LacI family DNA-binding transcriptional regulator [Burkholderia sp. BCC0044]
MSGDPVVTPAGTRRKRDARFIEIAAEAGVSEATVNRVLNERGSVSESARERVIAAARRLGVRRVLPDSRHGLIHIDVLLSHGDTPFFRRLNAALQRSAQILDKRIVLHRLILPESDRAVVDAIGNCRYRRAGMIITTRDTAPVRAALSDAIGRGEKVVTLMTDISEIPRTHFAGIDNVGAGRTAGYFIGRLAKRAGRVLKLCGSRSFGAHRDRIAGFRAALEGAETELEYQGVEIETLDNADACYRAVLPALKQGDLVGIYNSGYGSAGIAAALKEFDVAGKVVWVGHEMLDEHRVFIDEGTMDIVIDQNPDAQVTSALQHLLYGCGVLETTPPIGPVEFGVFCAANVRRSPYLSPDD